MNFRIVINVRRALIAFTGGVVAGFILRLFGVGV